MRSFKYYLYSFFTFTYFYYRSDPLLWSSIDCSNINYVTFFACAVTSIKGTWAILNRIFHNTGLFHKSWIKCFKDTVGNIILMFLIVPHRLDLSAVLSYHPVSGKLCNRASKRSAIFHAWLNKKWLLIVGMNIWWVHRVL